MSDRYFVKTDRLGFRLWRQDDLGIAQGLWGDYRVTRLIDARGKLSKVQVQERLAKEIACQREHGVQYWPIFLLESDEHLGCCGLRPYDLSRRIYEIGFHIRSNHWRRGYAYKAASAVIGHAFNHLKATALFAGHHPKNERSRSLLEKLGFQYIRDEYYPPTGLDHPSYLLTADDHVRNRG
jgi:RimJ/RimL family protein N-acetyltransferase